VRSRSGRRPDVAQTLGQRYVSTVLLVKALGGGWTVAALPAIKTDTPR
jgi:hypothetical protein